MGHLAHYELERLVNFFYHGEYSHDLEENVDISLLQLHARMFSLADQYEIPHLGALAAHSFASRCTQSWLADEFLASISDIYETTPSSVAQLRVTACMEIRKHLPAMLHEKDAAEMYERTLTEVPDFAKDLLNSYVQHPLYRHCRWCNSNEPMEALQRRCLTCKKGT